VTDFILTGDSGETLATLGRESVDCVVTSPPYFNLRNYHDTEGQLGLEDDPDVYIEKLVGIFRQVWRVMKKTATLWVNIGDSYSESGKGSHGYRSYLDGKQPRRIRYGIKPKCLIGIPWRFALAMVESGWTLRQDIIWAKRNSIPESVKDRFCKSHEHIFLFAKQGRYYFDHSHALEAAIGHDRCVNSESIFSHYKGDRTFRKKGPRWAQRGYWEKNGDNGQRPQRHGAGIETGPMRTMRDVWFLPTAAYKGEHYAVYPEDLIRPCILCGCPEGGVVLDPFFGTGTTGAVARKNNRHYIGCEINPAYVKIAERRIANTGPLLNTEGEKL
jgi:DNA modification methylase